VRIVIRFVGIFFALTIALLLGVFFYVQDANRLKPEIEALINENSDFHVEINGELKWQLLPPLTLQISNLVAKDDELQIDAGSVNLKMDLSAMWQDTDRWKITALQLTDTTVIAEQSTIYLQQFELENFTPGEPANFFADATYTAAAKNTQPIDTLLEGQITYFPAIDTTPQRIHLTEFSIDSAVAKGVCEADVRERDALLYNGLPEETDDDILPLALLLGYDIVADCDLRELTINEETFQNSTLKITNAAGQLNILADVQDFLGGSVLTNIDVDAITVPIQWTITPQVTNVDSQRLMDWVDQRLRWIAPIAVNSVIKMQGNTEADLLTSVQAQSNFDGGQGQLDISAIKQQLMQLAVLTRRTDKVAAWPDLWNYEQFTGSWAIDGTNHILRFALDNMEVDATGTVDYANESMDILANVTLNEAPETSPFHVNSLLEGTPIPIRCTGPTAEPECKLDDHAVQNLIADALRSDSETGLRKKIEDKIEEDVPEEYQDMARKLLDLLGGSLEKRD